MDKIYGKFVLGNIFEKVSAKYIGNKADKKKNVSRIKNKEYCVPLVYAKSGDNGIMYWAKENTFQTFSDVLSIIYNGAIATGLVYAHKQPTGILAESYFIKAKNADLPFECYLYLKVIIQKTIFDKYSRDYLATWDNKVEKEIIYLPVKQSVNKKDYDFNDIDFNFIECFVKKIQNEIMKSIEEYIDTKINDKNTVGLQIDDILSKKVNFVKFKVNDIFNIKSSNGVYHAINLKIYSEKIQGMHPYVVRTSQNNGVRGFISGEESKMNESNTISFAQDTAEIFYQKEKYFTGNKIKVLSLKNNIVLNEYIGHYLIKMLKIGFTNFKWGVSYDEDVLRKVEFALPIKNKRKDNKYTIEDVDFDYMEKYIMSLKIIMLKNISKYIKKLPPRAKYIENQKIVF